MNKIRQRKAFTIIEMTVVIAVIAILAAAMIPTVSGAIQKATISADTQFAAGMNIQLAMWEVDQGSIRDEEDLRAAINHSYGTAETPDYYASLLPKSSKYGYHFFYDVQNKQVILKRYEDLLPDPAEPALLDAGILAPTFAPSSPRSLVIGGKNYFLMDHYDQEKSSRLAGSILSAGLSALDYCDEAIYTVVINALEQDKYDKADLEMARYILKKLKNTAIAGDNGLFAYTGHVSYVYIPVFTHTISATSYVKDDTALDLTGVSSIYLPDGVKVATGALTGFKTDNSDVWHMPGATTLHVDAKEEDLKDVLAAESTDCVIQLPDGNRYTIHDALIYKLTETGTIVIGPTGAYSQKVSKVTVTVTNEFAENQVKAKIVGTTLYIAYDYIGDITLRVEALDESGNIVTNPGRMDMRITGDGMSMADGKINVSKENAGDGTFTVTVQGNQYVYNVVNVGIQSLTITSIGGKTPTDYTGEGYNYTAVYQLGYTSSSSFSVVTAVTPENSYVDVDKAVTMSSNTYVAYSNSNLSVKSGVTNQRTEVTFSCGGKTALCALNLIDITNSPFDKSQLLSSNESRMGQGNVYFGTQNATLRQLFELKAGVNINNQNVTYKFKINDWVSQSQTVKAENWATSPMTFGNVTGDNKVTVSISVGGKSAEVTVNLVSGAKNVAQASDWATTNGTDLCLLTDLKNFADNAGRISVTNATVYGNLHKIYWDDGNEYNVTGSKGNHAIITLNNGVVDNLIIDGPNYTKTSLYSASDTSGVYVFGVYANGTATINNSYISGFMAPVGDKKANSTVNLTSTVLKGGAIGNIYVNETSITLNVTNCTMIRTYEGNLAAPGIYLDEKSTSTKISMTGTNQYTFATESQAKKLPGVSSLGDWVAGKIVTAVKNSVGVHKISGTTYVHIGVLMHTKATVTGWSNNTDYTINNVTYYYTEQSLLGLGAKACVLKGTSSGCQSTCATHTLKPAWGNSATEYLTHRTTNGY